MGVRRGAASAWTDGKLLPSLQHLGAVLQNEDVTFLLQKQKRFSAFRWLLSSSSSSSCFCRLMVHSSSLRAGVVVVTGSWSLYLRLS